MRQLAFFVLPLGLDTFAVSAALGTRGMRERERLRISGTMATFEAAMPLAGLALGRALSVGIGGIADYVAAAALFALGAWMLFERDDVDARRTTGVLALVALGLSVSLDELAIGFTIGLLRLPIAAAVILIAAQAFVFAQLGMRLGARVGAAREWAERGAGLALVGLGAATLVERLG